MLRNLYFTNIRNLTPEKGHIRHKLRPQNDAGSLPNFFWQEQGPNLVLKIRYSPLSRLCTVSSYVHRFAFGGGGGGGGYGVTTKYTVSAFRDKTIL